MAYLSRQSIHHRKARGQALTGFIAFVGLFVVGALGMLAFEISRYALAKNELQTSVDAAALAGSATLAIYIGSGSISKLNLSNNQASASSSFAATAQTAAMTAAIKLFRQNSVLGQSLANAQQATSQPLNPVGNQSLLMVELLAPPDPLSLTPNAPPQPVAIGNPNGKIIRVTGACNVAPVFSTILPVTSVPAFSTSTSAVPMLDVVDCFAVGGAMDDQTLVTFVKRIWVPSAASPMGGAVEYKSVATPAGAVAEGTIAQVLGNPPLGTDVNGLEPQGLESADTAPSPLKFSETQASTKWLRGVTNASSPPGNYPGQVLPPSPPPAVGGPDVFTDLVVNLDGNAHFNGITVDGYSFPNIGVVVEAARGNLESTATFSSARLIGNPLFVGITPTAGYKLVYEKYAGGQLSPFTTGRYAALNFTHNLMDSNSTQVSEISFHGLIGSTLSSTFQSPNVSNVFSPAGVGQFILPNQPLIPMDQSLFGVFQQMCFQSAARVGGPQNNAGLAISGALQNLQASRRNADRSIVLFTNSAPTTAEMNATRSAAQAANNAGVPIFVVGLAETPATASLQLAAFSDSNSNPNSGGVCAIAGRGSRFFQVTRQADIPQAFGNVARQLVKLGL